MKKLKANWLVLLLGVLLVCGIGIGWLLYSSQDARFSPGVKKRPSRFALKSRAWFQNHIRPLLPQDWRVDISGTPGTPVVVGYRIDGFRSGVFRGVTPTNFTVQVVRRLYCAIKNVGNTNAQLGYSASPVGGSSSPVFYPPCYGFSGEFFKGPKESGSRGGGNLLPTDWPVTLPPGMTERAAKTHDFAREADEIYLKDHLRGLEQNPQDVGLLNGVGRLNFQLKNYAAGEEAYARFFAAECSDAMFLNSAIWGYVEGGGTNLERAYEIAVKAQTLSSKNAYLASYVDDTVGWILLKQGDYQQALSILMSSQKRLRDPAALFHVGMAHYMLLEEDSARTAFQQVEQAKMYAVERNEAKKCLAMLDLKAQAPKSKAVEQIKARLMEAPDDPVALSRLGEFSELAGPSDKPQDALVMKALGVRAFGREEYSRAAELLTESSKGRGADAEVFFYLGMACNKLNQKKECTESLSKALALHLKAWQAAEARRVLASLSRESGG